MDYEKEIARALLRIGAVKFCVEEPVTFVSGIRSPVYCDNRKFPFHPKEWHILIDAFAQKIKQEKVLFDVVAGVETSGIPHSSALAYLLQKPSVFIRKKAKEHGTKSRIEGGDVKDKTVLLLEDLVTTGASSLAVVQALREAGARVNDCAVIVTYGFEEAKKAFESSKVNLHVLTSFPTILREAKMVRQMSQKEKNSVES
ncbi:MAG: orotate phosphoribosyltransferase [Parcubacteria group bacterium Gr01-1014_30]|nr:MAG: orotate phosphoribosyltransferase [Parcubacteria group bacterium Gr01-1014_30]